jgi:spore coat protein U domain-containing protein, fimbrial subunit CupE1/2/3/6
VSRSTARISLSEKTGKSGKILAPGLHAYQKNQIRIETEELPINAEIPVTQKQTVVAKNSGSVVRFGVKTEVEAALAVLKLGDGSFVPAGSVAKLNGGAEEFVVGYDGQTYFTGLKSQNIVEIELSGGRCLAEIQLCRTIGSTNLHRRCGVPMKFIAKCAKIVGQSILIWTLWTGSAAAQSCTFTIADMDWGDIDLGLDVNFDLTGTMAVNCTGTASTNIRHCLNIGSGPRGVNGDGSIRYMLDGATQLQYNLYKTSFRNSIWGSVYWGLSPTPPGVFITLNSSGTASQTRTIYGRIFFGQTALTLGIYSSSFSGNDARFDYGYSGVFTSCTGTPTFSVNAPFNVSARHTGSCTVSATTLDFGTQRVLDNDVDATNTVTVTCTNGACYSVGLNEGTTSGGTTTTRKMEGQTSSATIDYQMFQDAARTTNWGNASGSWVT